MSRAILVTGGSGQLGTEFQRCTWPHGYELVAINAADLNLLDTAAIAAKVAERPWSAVINGAYGIQPRPWRGALEDILDETIGAQK